MSGFEKMLNEDGTKNTKYVDLLDEDKPISGQKFACISFVSPENILKQKNLYFFEKFLNHWDFSKCVKKSTQFLNFLSYKNNLNFDEVMKDFEEFIKSERNSLIENTMEDEWRTFMDKCEEELETEFNNMNNFQTSVRGLKVRGVYATQEEAEFRCKMLREVDPYHNVYVGPVGMWMPWEPDAYKTGRVEYLEEQLNQLMKEKNDNDEYAKRQFDKRVMEAKKEAIDKNIKLAKETGNKLTQNINEDGELVGTMNNTIERSLGLGEEVTQEEVENQLFKGENVRTSTSDSPKTARKKMVEYYENLKMEENNNNKN
tara:strand:+ start:2995 stop:3939 length:945 start_codon:yes stop_codon:yes gene_type:complete